MAESGDLPRVLIVDDSRIVRATIIKHLRGSYDFREEVDGEAGWETIRSDPAIQVVISDLSMPRLDGYGLLSRIRAAEDPRVASLPFVLISGDEDEESRARAKSLGASDFITKGIGTAELLARLASLVRLSQASGQLEAARGEQVRDSVTGLFSQRYIEAHATQVLSSVSRHNLPVSLIVIGVDQFDTLASRLGDATVRQFVQRFGQLIAAKIRKGDSLGHYSDVHFAVLSPGAAETGAQVFAKRLREAIEQANVAVQGQRIALTVSIGVASCGPDTVDDGPAFLELAAERMRRAIAAGGNLIVGSDGQARSGPQSPPLDGALALLRAGRATEVSPFLGELILSVMPLLRLADQELDLGLPLTVLETKLNERAQTEKDARQ